MRSFAHPELDHFPNEILVDRYKTSMRRLAK